MILEDENNLWKIYGKMQIMIQYIFWALHIYICDCNLIFDCFDDSVIQFLILFVCVYHQICALRSFYYSRTVSSVVSPISKDELENKYILKTTECKKCGIIRPFRSHHCSICEKCIDKLDHHCFLLNNCIGRKNYKYFFSYLFLSFLNSIIGILLGLFTVYLYKKKEIEKLKHMKFLELNLGFIFNFPIKAILLLMVGIPTFIGSLYLLIYHLFLVYKSQTTIERKYPKLYIEENNKKNISFCEKLSKTIENNNWLNIYWLE